MVMEIDNLGARRLSAAENIQREDLKKLPKPLEWRSFYNNDLNLLVDICKEVRDVSV